MNLIAIIMMMMMASNINVASGCAVSDSATYQFALDYDSTVIKTCSWLTKGKHSAKRIAKYCARGGVANGCKVACSNTTCQCADAIESIKPVYVLSTKNTAPCWWLDWKGQLHPKTVTRRKKYCSATSVQYKLDQYCPSGCGHCADTQPDWVATDDELWNDKTWGGDRQ